MKTNSNYAKRKQIIEPSKEEFGKMYQIAPIRQILALKLSPFQQILLFNFFSHDYWKFKLSINGISKSFGNNKNRSDVVNALKELGAKGYLITTEFTYKVNMEKINADYKLSIAKGEEDDSSAIINTDIPAFLVENPAIVNDSPAIISSDSSAPIVDSPAIIPPDSSATISLDSPAINNKRTGVCTCLM